MTPCPRLAEKLRKLGLSADDAAPSSTPRTHGAATKAATKASYTFSVYFPLPPFDGIHFNALKAGHGAFNFTGQLLGVGGRQLQRIKRESNARVEVVNAVGNLNGAHPDPLDPDLHARISADSLAKLQKAVHLVWELLQPVNARFEPIEVVPGGAARLTVVQPASAPGKTQAAAAATKHHKGRPSHDGSSSSSTTTTTTTSSSTNASSSSSSSTGPAKGPPPSPALTPVTPAAVHGRHTSVFAAASGPGSRSSSRAATPQPVLGGCSSPSTTDTHSAHGGGSSGGSSSRRQQQSRRHVSSGVMEDFRLPPAAVPPAALAPLATEEWPALPLAAAASGSGSKQHGGTVAAAGAHTGAKKPQASTGSSSPGSASERTQDAGASQGNGTHAPAGSHDRAGVVGSSCTPAGAHSQPGAMAACEGGDSEPDSQAQLSPLTPQAQQGAGRSSDARGPGSGSTTGSCAAAWQAGSSSSGLGLGHGFGSSSPGDGAPVHAPCAGQQLCTHLQPHQQQPQQPHHHQEPPRGDLDLHVLRQRAGLVSQACLLGADMGLGALAACGGLPPPAMASSCCLPSAWAPAEGQAGVLHPSAGGVPPGAMSGGACGGAAAPGGGMLPLTCSGAMGPAGHAALMMTTSLGAPPPSLTGLHVPHTGVPAGAAAASGPMGARALGSADAAGDAAPLPGLQLQQHAVGQQQQQQQQHIAGHQPGDLVALLAGSWDARLLASQSQAAAVAAAASTVFGGSGGGQNDAAPMPRLGGFMSAMPGAGGGFLAPGASIW